ncbi:helix-turn-helix transcriptional regulator [Pseudomonas sp. gcc21]|uniref:helix-turn-helix domain-containing protein n=1 Tax=Pseudomonas sp. gcc21 TaxID=2726989 RepID=UPI0014519862|nr:helix-turn-helix transcriptional regulator [Pseudomonas sp. gcc21]QJD58172.1 helix-turn-helix transcriptional regulator [Pseudomonas sp. gcc21]
MNAIVHNQWKGFLDMGLALRELEFTLMVAAGMTGKEIAKQAGLAPDSVKKRIASAMFKLKASNRPQLIANAIRNGIIAPLAILLMVCTVVIGGTPDLERAPRGKVRITRIAKPGTRDDLLYNPFDYV